MQIRKINESLLAIVVILLISAILVLVKILFADFRNFQMGSLSDWVSSLSTLGTLFVAYAAYKKAPEWLNRKIDEDSLTLSTNSHYILVEDINTYAFRIRNLINHPRNRAFPFSNIMNEVANTNGNISRTMSTKLWNDFNYCVKFDAFPGIVKAQIDLVKNLNRLKFMGWRHKKEKKQTVDNIINGINNITNLKLELNIHTKYALNQSRCFAIAQSDQNIINNLKSASQLVYPVEKAIDLEINKIINELAKYKSYEGDFFEYFTNKKSK